jgi:phosphatidylglycerophosphatase A
LYLLIISSIVFILGWSATFIETKERSEHDPSEIVIDEVVGQWITFTPLFIITSNEKFHTSISRSLFNININSETYSMNIILIFLSSFILFRFFDIIKPWPISWADRISTPFGVMFDDILAGIFSAICLTIILFFGLLS